MAQKGYGCEPSYEGWKPLKIQEGLTGNPVVSLPTRDGNVYG